MADPSARMLRLLSLLQTHRYWAGEELAGRLEVSLRTVRRDVDRLRELGYPVQANRGVDGGYQLAAGAALPPLVLDDEEAVALAVALQAAAQGSAGGTAEASLRALAKVAQVMPPRLRRRVEALRSVTEMPSWSTGPEWDPQLLVAAAQACRDSEVIRFSYRAKGGQDSERAVEPHRLVSIGRRWYLVGYDLDRQDWRSFRADRMSGPSPTGRRFRPRELPATDAVAFVRAGIERISTTFEVEAIIDLDADAVRGRLGRWATVQDAGPDRCVLRMRSDSLDWPAMALGTIGADFRVVRPAELVDHLREWGRRFSAVLAAGDS